MMTSKKAKGNDFFYSLFIDRILESLYSHHIKKSYKSIVIKLTATESVIMFSSESHFKNQQIYGRGQQYELLLTFLLRLNATL